MGATGRLACDLALHLRSKGHRITIITTAPTFKHDRAKNLDVIRIASPDKPEGMKAYLKTLRAMNKTAKKLPRHDVVISMTDPPLLATIGRKIAKKMRAKHVHWAMDIYPDLLPVMGYQTRPLFYKIAYKRMHKAIKNADMVVPISLCMARYLNHQSIPKQQMDIIENWPDKYLLENEGEPEPLLDANKFRILYAGTIGLAHDFDTVLKGALYFQKTDRDIEFVFTARGGGYKKLAQQVREMGLNNIRFLQPQSSKKLISLMASGDVHLVTIKDSAAGKLFPSKFYSACAASRPIIYVGPANCDIDRKISKTNCGATIRHGDTRTFTNAITNFKNNSDDWFRASTASNAILDNHNPLQQWCDLIDRL